MTRTVFATSIISCGQDCEESGAWDPSGGIRRDTSTLSRRCAQHGYGRILVSGSADYSLIAHINTAFQVEGRQADITVLDACKAPLVINRWYARRHGFPITSIALNLFDFEDEEGFDVITTDNFFTNFQSEDRARIVTKWRHLLRPSGKIITAQNISIDNPGTSRALGTDDITSRLNTVFENASMHRTVLDVTPEQLVQFAAIYYQRRNARKVTSIAEFCDLFESRDFDVEAISELPKCVVGSPRGATHFQHVRPVHFVMTKIHAASDSPQPGASL